MVGPLALREHIVTEQLLLQGVEKMGGLAPLVLVFFGIAFDQRLADRRDLAVAFELHVLRGVHGLVKRRLGLLPDLFKQRIVSPGRLKFSLAGSKL